MDSVKEFRDYSKEYDTEQKMYGYFTDLISSPAIGKYISPEESHITFQYFLMPEHLKKIKGFREKVENFVIDVNKALLVYSLNEIGDKFDLHDAFVNKTEPIIKSIQYIR